MAVLWVCRQNSAAGDLYISVGRRPHLAEEPIHDVPARILSSRMQSAMVDFTSLVPTTKKIEAARCLYTRRAMADVGQTAVVTTEDRWARTIYEDARVLRSCVVAPFGGRDFG